MTVTVVIPTLNEGLLLASTLRSVKTHCPDCEIVVADGGSQDGTLAIAAETAHIVSAVQGRATQMNAGASVASGEILLFLHADTLLIADAIRSIRRHVDDGYPAGTFRLQFTGSPSPLLRLYASCTRLRARSICFGDRGLYVTREVFDDLGGFPVMPVFEDLEMVRRLSRNSKFAFLPEYVRTSSRRFEHNGAFRQQLLNLRLWLGYQWGTDPERLATRYKYSGS